jgi:hypothetical protein
MLKELREYLAGIAPGDVQDKEKWRIEVLLADAWDAAEILGDDGGMTGEKVCIRTENLVWEPPLLRFEIERHGALCQGSKYGEVQIWEFDVEDGTAGLADKKRRLLKPLAPRVYAAPIADEIVRAIRDRSDRPWLKFYGQNAVRILVGRLGKLQERSPFNQTREGRNKRLRKEVCKRMEADGWRETTVWKFERTSQSSAPQ